MRFDAVLTTLPVPERTAPVVIELPWTWETPVRLTVNDVKQELRVGGADAIREVLALLDKCLLRN